MATTSNSQRHVLVFETVGKISVELVAFDFDNMETTGCSCSTFNVDSWIKERNLGKWPVIETSFTDHKKIRDCLFDLKGSKEFKPVEAIKD